MVDDRFDHRAGASAGGWRAPGKRGADAQGLGRSRGGLSTKIHAAADALGNPVRLIGSPGQRNDIAFAHQLIEGFAAAVTIADKGYDADHLCDKIAESGGEPVIPPKRNRTFKRPYDDELYKERSASSASSNSSAASQPATTSCSPTLQASSNLPLSPSGSNS
jgi:putative transposase